MKKVLITGATGLIGKKIVEKLHDDGIPVHYLTTSKHKISNDDLYKGFYWNPSSGEIDVACFEGATTIVNLAGASIAKKWTASYKEMIINSRVDSIKLLFNTIKENNFKIDHFISASAVGYYPDSLTQYYDESFISEDDSFIVDVVKRWEEAADNISTLGITVAKVRIGLVLSRDGGALPKLMKPIQYFVGSALGSGKQWQPWIHISDLANMFIYIMKYQLEGVYNGVAPNAISNASLTKAIGKALGRPIWLPNVPTFMLKLMLGEMSQIVLIGHRISSKKIEDKGFDFEFHTLQQALEDLLPRS